MTQSYYIKTLSGVSVLILTLTNIFLTVRLLHSTNCSSSSSSSSSSPYSSNKNNNVGGILIKDKLILQAPKFQSKSCPPSDYEIQHDINSNKNNFNSLDGDFNNHNNINNEKLKLQQINFSIGRWDNQHLYKFYDFIIIGTKFIELSEKYTVCLATQSSIERLNSLVQVSEHWNGPISISIFTAGDDEFNIFQLFINYLRNCYSSIRDNVSFHLAVPKDKIPKNFNLNNLKFHNFDNNKFYSNCGAPSEIILRRLLKLRTADIIKWRQKHPYPQNHMRNLARKGCQTSNVFLTDVDIIPSINFTQNIDKFLRKAQCKGSGRSSNGINGIGLHRGIIGGNKLNGGLCAYVVPTYEIDFRVKFPSNKSDLLRLVNKGLARPFHEKVFVYNQFATNFSRWQKNETSDIDTHVSHDVTNFEFLYEPFYISSDNVPIHDERFLGYGFTRNSQVYEMYIAGYKFQVLSPVFTCHWGLQQKKTRPAWREQQNNVNRKHFEHFKKEILARYSKEHISPKAAPPKYFQIH